MLKSIIRTLLQKFIDDIDSDNCNITMEQQSKIISVSQIPGTGIYLCWFEHSTNTLQLLTGVV